MNRKTTRFPLAVTALFLLFFSAFAITKAAPIHDAARDGDLTNLLAQIEAEPLMLELLDEIGASPLWVAAVNGHSDVVATLIDLGADPSSATIDGLTGLHWAALKGDVATCRTLLEGGADVNARSIVQQNTPLHEVWNGGGQPQVARLLVSYGADVNAVERFYGMTPLHYAASKNQPDVATVLLDAGASAAIEDNSGRTADAYAYNAAVRSAFESAR